MSDNQERYRILKTDTKNTKFLGQLIWELFFDMKSDNDNSMQDIPNMIY